MKKNNKRIKLIKILLSLIIILVITLLISLNFLNKRKGQIIAKVNGEKIYKSEVNSKLKEILQNTNSQPIEIEKLPSEMLEALVKDIFAQRKLDEEIGKSRLSRSDEIKEKINDYAKKIARKEYLDAIIKDKVNEKAVKDKYAELTAEIAGKREVHLRQILVKSEAESKDILKKIKEKKSFIELAKKYSVDKTTAAEGGDLGFIVEDDLTQEFSGFVQSAKIGSVSSPIKTNYGWHIIKVEGVKDAEMPLFESVKASIEEQLKKDEINKIYLTIIESAKVKIMINLEPVNKENK